MDIFSQNLRKVQTLYKNKTSYLYLDEKNPILSGLPKHFFDSRRSLFAAIGTLVSLTIPYSCVNLAFVEITLTILYGWWVVFFFDRFLFPKIVERYGVNRYTKFIANMIIGSNYLLTFAIRIMIYVYAPLEVLISPNKPLPFPCPDIILKAALALSAVADWILTCFSFPIAYPMYILIGHGDIEFVKAVFGPITFSLVQLFHPTPITDFRSFTLERYNAGIYVFPVCTYAVIWFNKWYFERIALRVEVREKLKKGSAELV